MITNTLHLIHYHHRHHILLLLLLLLLEMNECFMNVIYSVRNDRSDRSSEYWDIFRANENCADGF